MCDQDFLFEGALRGAKGALFGPQDGPAFYISIASQPNCGMYTFGDSVLVLCEGLKNAPMSYRFHYGWRLRSRMEAAYGFLPAAREWAVNLWNTELINRIRGKRRIVFCGHSGGGPTMEYLAYIVAGFYPGMIASIVTCGSPRAILDGFQRNCPWWERYRFMNVGDPVVNLPPHLDESPASWRAEATLGVLAFGPAFNLISFANQANDAPQLWNSVVHTPGGIMLWNDGRAARQESPLPGTQALGDIINWAIFSDWRHSKLLYQQNIARALRREPQPDSQAGPGAGGDWGVETVAPRAPEMLPAPTFEAPDPVTVAEVSFILPIPQERLVFVEANPIRTGSTPGTNGERSYPLFLGGYQIATYPSRGRAETAARHLKGFLRRLANSNEVSQEELTAGLLSYLQGASQGLGVSKTPVNVV